VPLRDGLEDAHGVSEYAIAVICDIRGYSDFCDDHESPDVATYIREVLIRLIDDYFPFGQFYKSMGDGLLVMVHFDRENVIEVVRRTVDAAIRCVDDFPDLCHGNPMITFPTPHNIGFGIARGTTCCLVSNGRILDYTGHLLNLSSRLMGLARPRGIVLDRSVGVNLLDEDVQTLFLEQQVYIRGIAEQKPHTVFTQKDHVVIPQYALQPLEPSPPPTPAR
jgi:class 3 adenylate cyclase